MKKSEDKIEQAKQLIKQEEEKQTKDCVEEINQVLERHNRQIKITPNIIINGQEPQLVIIPKK